MDKFDEKLFFNLPEDFYALDELDDEGDRNYRIASEKSVNDDGEDQYNYVLFVNQMNVEDSPFSVVDENYFFLDCNFENKGRMLSAEKTILFFTVTVYELSLYIKLDDKVYAFSNRRACRDDEEMQTWLDFVNIVFASAKLDGKSIGMEKLSSERLSEAIKDADELAAKNGKFPYAKPKEKQHTHIDFLNKTKASMSIFGNMVSVNDNGTEYSFVQLEKRTNGYDEYDEDDEDEEEVFDTDSVVSEILSIKLPDFDLVETAHDMAELFRVNVDFFDEGHDREQEILAGYIQKAELYEKFRSFAWTFAAYCDQEKVTPASVEYSVIQEMVEYIESRNNLNYTADSFSPVICSGDDIGVYYLPDGVSERTKKKLVNNDNIDVDETMTFSFASLNSLRVELEYMYPAIRAIYDELEASRDRDEALEGGTSDILYAWCSMTYASRAAMYSEDGPMNCYYEHPDNERDWEKEWAINSLKSSIETGKEWLNNHKKHLSTGSRIVIKDNVFVFAGIEGADEWLDILERFTALGGIHRNAVSGKTNYVVCNPISAGESKVKHALEQRIKGKDVKIILFDDFLKAIDMSVKTPQEKLAELTATNENKKEVKDKHIKNVERPSDYNKSSNIIEITYNNKTKVNGNGYSMLIPDGFVVKEETK